MNRLPRGNPAPIIMHVPIWLDAATPLPDPDQAPDEELLAVGADLSIARLREAYSKGLFPWFNEGEPVLWWSLDPRMMLACADFSPSHSLRKKLRQLARMDADPRAPIQIRMNTAFAEVVAGCATARGRQDGTWISPSVQAAYLDWHRAGQVHSIETWMNGELAGGLYGVGLGRMFCGESMFSRATDASKLALAYLVNFLGRHGVQWIDCQQQTGHLASLGARPMARRGFLALLKAARQGPAPPWGSGRLLQAGLLDPRQAKTP